MSDWFETVVDLEVTAEGAAPLAARVLAELVAKSFVRPEPTDCVLAARGHPPAPGVVGHLRKPDAALLRLATNGL